MDDDGDVYQKAEIKEAYAASKSRKGGNTISRRLTNYTRVVADNFFDVYDVCEDPADVEVAYYPICIFPFAKSVKKIIA